MDKIKAEAFRNPSAEYRIYPICHNLSDPGEDMEQKLQKTVVDTGAGGVVTNVAWTDGWIEDRENMRRFRDSVRLAREKGLGVWVYDEYWYPSGWAKGLVIRDHKENSARNISFVYKACESQCTLTLTLPEDGFEFIHAALYPLGEEGLPVVPGACPAAWDKSSVSAEGKTGFVLIGFYIRRHNVSHFENTKPEELPGGYREYLNFLNRDAVDAFIRCALEPYKTGMPEFSDMVEAIFTDEPALMSMFLSNREGKISFNAVPWGDTLFQRFRELHGYDLTPWLLCLFFGEDEESKTIRVQYYRTVAQLMEENFVLQMREWCRKAGVKLSGHMLLEEALPYHVGYYADLMKVFSAMDYPGFDMLTGSNENYWTRSNAWGSGWYMGAKYASSAARLAGHNMTMLEICPVMAIEGFDERAFENFMALTTSITFAGCTHMNAYRYDSVKDLQQYNRWNEYTGRIQYMLREAVPDSRIGVYYPIADAQAAMTVTDLNFSELSGKAFEVDRVMADLALDLYRNKLDFTVVTEEALLNGSVETGGMGIGASRYDVMLMPSITVLPLPVLEKLKKFAQSGGCVYFIGRTPQMGVRMEEHRCVRELFETLRVCGTVIALPESGRDLYENIKVKTGLTLKLEGDPGNNLLVSRYRREGNTLYYLINISKEDIRVRVCDSMADRARLYEPETGGIEECRLPVEIRIKSERGVFIEMAAPEGCCRNSREKAY